MGNEPRLEIRDRESGLSICLDALELLSLSWCTHNDLAALVDPSRWSRDREGLERDSSAWAKSFKQNAGPRG